METIKLNPQGDIDIQNGELLMVSGDDEIRQKIWLILSVNLEEWFLDLDYGLDYSVFMDNKIYSEMEIRNAIEESILQIEEIDNVDVHTFKMDSKKRHLTIDVTAYTRDAIIEMEEVFEIE